MNDLIYRQAAIYALGERPEIDDGGDYDRGRQDQFVRDKIAIESLSPVQPELIHCADCRFYNKIITVCAFVGEHEGSCRHPQGCIATDSWGYCHYALRKEDVPCWEAYNVQETD